MLKTSEQVSANKHVCAWQGRGSFFFSFFHTSTFQLLDKPWSQVSSLLPPRFLPSILSRIGFSNPTARRFSSSVANSRSRACRKSNCAIKKKSLQMYASMHSGDLLCYTDCVWGAYTVKLCTATLESNRYRCIGTPTCAALASFR